MTDLDQKQLGRTLWNIADKLAALKTHKKGLMQQLFPDLEESVSPLPEAGRGQIGRYRELGTSQQEP